jgi:hypothetical protein
MLLGLRVGDPADEVLGAWLAKESVRDVYLAEDPAEAALLLDKTIAGCLDDEVTEIVSLGNTLARWRAEILAHHDTGASNGPTEGLDQPVREEGEALRAWLPELRALPAARAPPRRRCRLAEPSSTAAHPNPRSPLKRIEPATNVPGAGAETRQATTSSH